MKIENVLTAEELTALRLRALYAESGYQPYKMSKFEAYDLYAGNKDFLASDRIITFTDVSGRLMALKPDVTLSIIKNTELLPGETQKLYYNETVYRVPKGAPGFREMTQVGLECIGETDISAAAEVLSLACRSLGEISAESVLDLSHFGLIGEALRGAGLYGADAEKALACLNDKNAEGMAQVCRTALVPKKMAERLGLLVTLYGAPDAVLPGLEAAFPENPFVEELKMIARTLKNDMLRIDFSVPGNIKYYNGIVFKGYVKGVPGYVLSGGQYDHLLRRMKKNYRALGFAVYMDSLQQLENAEG